MTKDGCSSYVRVVPSRPGIGGSSKMNDRSPQGVQRQEITLRVYHGHGQTREREAEVMVRGERLEVLTHHFRHSPEGFAWGDDSLGSKELSRSLLLDAFGHRSCPTYPLLCQCTEPDTRDSDSHKEWVEAIYGEFCDKVIAGLLENQDWDLAQLKVMDWAFDHINGPAEVPVEVPS